MLAPNLRSRKLLLVLALLGATLGEASAAAAESGGKPNILVILTDDQGWGDLSLHGNTDLRTPNFDSLAKDGSQFRRFFVQPVCSPTRAEFLTGRYHPRGGVRDVSTGGERLDVSEKTIADAFSAAGYSTGLFGKWHNGTQYPYHPLGRGFREFYGFTHGHWGEYFSPPLDHNGKPARGKGFLADDLTDHAIDFISKNETKPFLCVVTYNTPHSPMQVPDEYWNRFKDRELKLGPTPPFKSDLGHNRAALAMCENLDANVGRLLKTLNERNLAKQTIVVYFSDNGPNGRRFNGGMKGIKGSTDEGGVRSPLLVRWPGHIPAGTVLEPIAGSIDLYPTLADLAGVNPVGDAKLDGISLARAVLGKKFDTPDRVLFQHWNRKLSVRDQKFRLDADGKLFDLDADPGQTKNLAEMHPDVLKRLKSRADFYRTEVLSVIAKKDDRPYPVGHRELPATELPARDGVPHGTIKRSAGAPNCSYFTNWTRTDASITWPIEVATAGRYRIEVLYGCTEANLGTVLECRLGDNAVSRKIEVAHDPKSYGPDHDRAPRKGESAMKDLQPLSLGEMTLPAGRGELTLRATAIPGKQSAEVGGLVVTLLPTK